MSKIMIFESETWYTEQEAKEHSFWWSKGLTASVTESGERFCLMEPTYCTAMKGTPVEGESPKNCWFVTNKLDPRADKSAYTK